MSQNDVRGRVSQQWGPCRLCGSEDWMVTDRPSHLIDDEMFNSLATGEVMRAKQEGRETEVVGSTLLVWPVICDQCGYIALARPRQYG